MAQVRLPSWNGLKGYLSCLFIVYCSGKSGLIVQRGIVQRGTARSMRKSRDGYPNLTTVLRGIAMGVSLVLGSSGRHTCLLQDGQRRGEMPDRRSVWQEDTELKPGLLCGRFSLCFSFFSCLLFSMLLCWELPVGTADVFLCVCVASHIVVT